MSSALAELTQLMLATTSVEKLLSDVARLSGAVTTPPAACGITMRRDHQPMTVASSHPLAALVDEVQYGLDCGPCLQSLRTGEVVTVVDMADERRWGSYSAAAAGHGVRSSLSVPLVINGHSRGALNLYATVAGAFDDAARQRAEAFAAQVSAVLTVASRQAQQGEMTVQLRDALASRSIIDQAIGIIMSQRRCDAGSAFGVLRALSQNQNRKLRDVATEIVTGIGGREPDPTPFNEPDALL